VTEIDPQFAGAIPGLDPGAVYLGEVSFAVDLTQVDRIEIIQ
jgi:hypothetical protein